MKYLTSVTETYRVDSDNQVDAAIEEAKQDNKFTLLKYKCDKKEVKAKGEVIDEYFLLSLTKIFNDPKSPDREICVDYEVAD